MRNYNNFRRPSELGVTVWIEGPLPPYSSHTHLLLEVRIVVWIQEVNEINEITSDFDMGMPFATVREMTSTSVQWPSDIYVNELWVDQALQYDKMRPCKHNLSLANDILGSPYLFQGLQMWDSCPAERIWTPNTVFINSKRADIHRSPFKNVYGPPWFPGRRVRAGWR